MYTNIRQGEIHVYTDKDLQTYLGSWAPFSEGWRWFPSHYNCKVLTEEEFGEVWNILQIHKEGL